MLPTKHSNNTLERLLFQPYVSSPVSAGLIIYLTKLYNYLITTKRKLNNFIVLSKYLYLSIHKHRHLLLLEYTE